MDGRAFLDPAEDLVSGPAEAHWRAAAGRAYYALFQEAHAALRRWGFVIPPRENVHAYVRLRFLYSGDAQARGVGLAMERLVRLRNEADYHLDSPGQFQDSDAAEAVIEVSRRTIAILDQIESIPARRAAVIASIRP